ncbi:MAG: hypothetical protein PVF70_04530 [Anaerolineales bacterium]|jgi:hypothetical protein
MSMEASNRSRQHTIIIRLWQEALPSGRACWRGTINDPSGERSRSFEGKDALFNEVINIMEDFSTQKEKGGNV